MESVMTTVVFVHGAFVRDSKWWWHKMDPLLAEHGIASRPVDLPSCGENGAACGLAEDVAAVRAAIAETEGPVVVISHSYGGVVATEAAKDLPNVAHLVYLSACVPDGTSMVEADFVNPDDLAKIELRADGTAGEGGTKVHLLEELPGDGIPEAAISRLTYMGIRPATEPSHARTWKDVPSTFIVCTRDQDISIDQQRAHAKRTTYAVEIPTNHFAHLERPDLVRDILVDIVRTKLHVAAVAG
jgi:pimeloyl-ACP methyl ester carboxylesterase